MFRQPTEDDTFELRLPAHDDRQRRHIRWVSPGSMHADRVADVWESGGSLYDLSRVPGPWAVALWDPASQSHVLLSDPVGVHPLFVATTVSGGLVAGSWLAALADRDDVDDRPDPLGILLSASPRLTSPLGRELTRLAQVRAVPWAHAWFVDAGGAIRSERFWDPTRIERLDDGLTAPDCARLLDEAIGVAVADMLPPPGTRVAAHVSGGLDCTTVAARVHASLQQRGERVVRGYSWSPDEREVPRFPGDERTLLDDVEAATGIPMWKRYSDESGDWFMHLDPTRYPFNTLSKERFVLPHAAADGVQVMFSGWGGDELSSFNGRRVVPTLLRRGAFREVVREGKARQRVVAVAATRSSHTLRRYARYALLALPPSVQDWRHPVEAVRDRRELKRSERRLRAFSPLAADCFVDRQRRYGGVMSFEVMQRELLLGGHMQDRTSSWYQVGRLHGIDYRFPLLDVRVVECALSLPWRAFLSEGWDRAAFRVMAADHVPASIAWNVSKIEPANFYAPVRHAPERSTPEPEITYPDDPGVTQALALLETLRRSGKPAHTGVLQVHTNERLRVTSGGTS